MNNDTTVGLYINGKQAEKTLDILQKEAESLGKQLEEAVRRGDKAAQKQLNKSLKDVNQTIKQIQSSTKNVADVMARLDKATPHELRKTLTTLNQQLKHIERGTPAWDAHVQKIRQVKAEIDKVNAEMKESESLLVRMRNGVQNWGAMAAGAVAAFSGVVMAGKKAVNTYAEMQQEEANVRKYTGMTEEEVNHLNDAFKKMDTRTSREELNKLAQEAGRLGMQSEEDVLGFVKAADKINVALDDLGEGATLTLSKLTDIFGDKQRLGTEQSLLAVGSVINELSQNSTAAAPYLAEFAQRLAGVGAQAHMTIPEIMGFGAVLDSQGQKLEMSSTALSKVIMNLFKDPSKIAAATGLEIEKFSETCKRSTNEGLLMLLDRLHELGGIDALAPVFKDMGENGARASAVLAALAGNVDMVRQQQEAANVAFNEAVSIDKEFNVQNTTVQAGLEKARKGFTEMAVTLGKELMPIVSKVISSTSMTMRVMLKVIQFVKEYRTEIVGLAAAIAAYYAIVKAQDAWNAFTGGIKKAIEGVKAFNKALLANPYAAVAALVIALGTALYGFIKRQREAARAADEHRKALERQQEAERKTASVVGEVVGKYQQLKTEWERLTSAQEKKEWLDKNRDAFEQLGLNINSVIEADDAFIKSSDKVIEALKARAKANALQDLYQEKMKQVYEDAADLEDNNRRVEAGEGVNYSSDAWKEYLASGGERSSRLFKGNTYMGQGGTFNYEEFTEEGARVYNEFLDQLHQQAIDEAVKIGEKSVEDVFGSWMVAAQKEAAKAETATGGLVGDKPSGTVTTGGTTPVTGGGEDNKSAVDEWKKKAEAMSKVKLAQGKISEEEYQTEMLKLEAQYQTKLMKVSTKGSADYLQAMAATLEAKKKLREQDDKKDLKEQEAYLKIAYLQGTVSHKEYAQKMLELEVERKKKQLEKQKEGTQAYLEAQAAYLEASKKLQKEMTGQTVKDEEKRYSDERAVIQQNYADGKLTARAYQLATEKAELDHLQNMVNLYEEGSEERIKAQEKYNQRSLAIQQKHAQETQKMQERFRKEYFSKVSMISDPENYEEEKLQLEATKELLMAQATEEQKLQIKEAYMKAKYDLAKKYNDEEGMMEIDAAQATSDKIAEYLQSEGFKKRYAAFQTMVNGMGEIFSGLTSLIDAETSLQTAKIEKKYQAEIDAAGENKDLVAQLEAEKEKEIAKVKNEAEEKKYGMQIASAIAQTAIAAINAYSSAAAIPLIGGLTLGPIAAGMAVAAGAIQIATLKKQHEAAMAQGYAAGGYTMPGGKYQPAGIVHAGEWVASQELLANPTAAATIAQLDQAQRTNTIGQLSKPGPVLQSENSSFRDRKTPVFPSDGQNGSGIGESLDRLNKTLDNGIYAATTMTGDKGILRQQRRYEQLMRNKSKK